MLRRLYDRTMALAAHPHAMGWLALVAFVESSVFPIPPDVILAPMVLAERRRAWIIAAVCTIASVAGGVAGYAIGYYLFDTFGRPIVEFYGYAEQFARFRGAYNEYGVWIVAFFGLTPFPYKVITIASGVTGLDPAAFMIASLLSRGARFYLVAGLLWFFGPPIREFIERRLGLVVTVFCVGLIGGFVLLKYLV